MRDNVARYVARTIEEWKRRKRKVTRAGVQALVESLLDEIRRNPKRWRERN